MSDSVLVRREHSCTVLTINRPDTHNAVNKQVAEHLGLALEAANEDPSVRTVILTGSGDNFCAGADLKAVARGEAIRPTDARRNAWGFAGYVDHPVSKPTIAAVNGPAVGGGFELVLASDLAVAADTAYFALPEVRHGIFAAAGGTSRLPMQLAPKFALNAILTGDRLSVGDALSLGLINSISRPADLLDEALRIASLIAANPANAVSAALRVARAAPRSGRMPDASSRDLAAKEWSALQAAAQRRRLTK